MYVTFQNDISPLHLACHYDHPNVANLLLEKGASPHLASQNGHTPLHIAARKNQVVPTIFHSKMAKLPIDFVHLCIISHYMIHFTEKLLVFELL